VLKCIASQTNKTPTYTSTAGWLLLPQSLPPHALAVSASAHPGVGGTGDGDWKILETWFGSGGGMDDRRADHNLPISTYKFLKCEASAGNSRTILLR
jgi:hypothetical protein